MYVCTYVCMYVYTVCIYTDDKRSIVLVQLQLQYSPRDVQRLVSICTVCMYVRMYVCIYGFKAMIDCCCFHSLLSTGHCGRVSELNDDHLPGHTSGARRLSDWLVNYRNLIYIFMHTYIHTYIHLVHTYKHTVHPYIYTYEQNLEWVIIYTSSYTYIYIHTYIHTYIQIFLSVIHFQLSYIHLHIYYRQREDPSASSGVVPAGDCATRAALLPAASDRRTGRCVRRRGLQETLLQG